MSRYETYKPSGIDWIGEVPEHWKVVSLKNILLSMTNGTTITQDPFEEGIPVTRIETISDGTINLENTGIIPSDAGIENYYLSKGDILFSHINSFEYVANCAIFDLDVRMLHGMNLLRLIPNKTKIEPYFLIYLLKSDYFKKLTQSVCNRAINQVSISNSKLKNFKIVISEDKTEQLTIANYLDDQTKKIDRLIANKKAQAEKLKELRQIEINNAVTKGLNPNVEMKDSGIEWLGKIPKHWELKKIKQLLKPEKNAIKTGPFGSDLKFEDLIEEGIKVYNQRSVLDNDWKSGEGYISAEKYESLKTCTIFPADIVITTRGTIGKVSIFPADAELGILHPCLMRIQMNSQRILNDYLKIIINDSSFFFEALKLASNATTIDVIYSDSLKEVKIPVPPTNEQVEITTYLQKKVSAIDQLIKNIEAQIEKLQELRKIKIYEAVTGKIKVNAYAETTA